MKTLLLLTVFVLALAATSVSFSSNAHAQNNPSILLHIAIQADTQILNQLDAIYGDSIPSDIEELYQNGHVAVESLEDSLLDDIEQSKENFLIAMKSFKQVTRMISESTIATQARGNDVDSSEYGDRDLQSELKRLYKYFENIRKISEKHDMGIDLSHIEQLFTLVRQQIVSEETEAASQNIEELEFLIEAIKQNIHKHESHSTSDRSMNFALKQLDKIKAIITRAELSDPQIPEIQEADFLVQEIESMLSKDNISDAKKEFKRLTELVKIIEKSVN